MSSLIDFAKSNELTICATGAASDDDVAIELIKRAAPDVKFSTVYFTGASECNAAVLGGHVDVGIEMSAIPTTS
jgi:tripartite-type tricarboxylate transporter receptor subunit TctC